MAKAAEVDYRSHIDFILAHSRHEPGDYLRTVPRSDYLKLAESDGVTPPVIESYNLHQVRMIGASVCVATDDLVPRIDSAREAGDDTSTLKNTVRIATPGGSTEVTVRATRVRQNPRTGDEVTRHGVVGVSIDADKRIPEDATLRARAVITKALGLTESESVKPKAE